MFGWEKQETEEAVLQFLNGIEELGWVMLQAKTDPVTPKWKAH